MSVLGLDRYNHCMPWVKEGHLRSIFRSFESCIIAFSGGVDSSYLAYVAHQELGQRALAITAESPSFPSHQRQIATDLAGRFGFSHEFIQSGEMQDPGYVSNSPDRCYFCKHDLYARLTDLAAKRGFSVVVDGNNVDDAVDFRPGRRAGRELAVRSPLIEVGLGKEEIRLLSREHGLPVWNQPASACLSSRIPYGSPVTLEKLQMIDQGEETLRRMGFLQTRVRHHGDIARIEIDRNDLARALTLENFDAISRQFKRLGFRYVAIDVDGYRTGALNEVLTQIQTRDQ